MPLHHDRRHCYRFIQPPFERAQAARAVRVLKAARTARRRGGGALGGGTAIGLAGLHDEVDLFQRADVRQRVPAHRHEVRDLAGAMPPSVLSPIASAATAVADWIACAGSCRSGP
ncbi:hypothetical protein [Hankyongella ginsenosidimutans]|uniref:hypothetical protein n=1 Tax=Hankyongella ginsenosidimutans TaxID=1763828 RepID=UPI001FE87463|nr:hypothetical protein [Hankyongella ginsenosidimutans]